MRELDSERLSGILKAALNISETECVFLSCLFNFICKGLDHTFPPVFFFFDMLIFLIHLKNIYWSIADLQCCVDSGVQQSQSVIHIHISVLFKIPFPYKPL